MQLLLLLLLVPRAIARPLTDADFRNSVSRLEEEFGPVETWNVSQVTDMSYIMFDYASSFNGDVSKWDVSQVTDMSYMFGDASSFNGDVSKWDVSNVTDMYSMFRGASSFNGDLSIWSKCPPLPDFYGPQCQRCPFSFASANAIDALMRIILAPIIIVGGLVVIYKSFSHDHEDHELIMDEDDVAERQAAVRPKKHRNMLKRRLLGSLSMTISHSITLKFMLPSMDFPHLPEFLQNLIATILSLVSVEVGSVAGPPECIVGNAIGGVTVEWITPVVAMYVMFFWWTNFWFRPSTLKGRNCPNEFTGFAFAPLIFYIIIPSIVFYRTVMESKCKRPSYLDRECEEQERYAFLFNKYHKKDYFWEFVFLGRKMMIAAISLFFTTKLTVAVPMCMACNFAVGLAMVIRKPFLSKANNNLELLMLTGEMCLWGAAMGNEMLLNKFNGFGDAVCLVLEWLGVSIFAFGYLFCVYEGIAICRIPKQSKETATVVPAESVEVVEDEKEDNDCI
eukprot:g4828.t1